MLLQLEMNAGVTCKYSTSLNVCVAHVHLVVGESLNVWFVIGSRTHQGIDIVPKKKTSTFYLSIRLSHLLSVTTD